MTHTNRQRRNLPYLHRNWLTAVNGWQTLGTKPAPQPGKAGDGFISHGHDDDHCSRPAKRQRLSEHAPDPIVSDDVAGFLLPEELGQLQRGLRIEILRIIHKDSSRVRSNTIFNGIAPPAVKDVSSTQARCRITITCVMYGKSRSVYQDSQLCEVKTLKNPVGPSRMARVYLPQPFHVSQEKILVEREDHVVFDLADNYTLTVELESAGDPNWPPLNLAASDDAEIFRSRPIPPRHWALSATVPDIFRRGRTSTRLQLSKKAHNPTQTDFIVDIDTRWTTGIPVRALPKRLEKDMLPSIAVLDVNEDMPPDLNGAVNENGHLVNGDLANGYHAADLVDEIDEDAEGELTPTRSLRHRENKVYNLKVLSDKAQGKERRKRRKLEKLRDRDEDSSVTYQLPVEQFVVDGFYCCICQAYNQSMSQLRAHLMSHGQYEFECQHRQGKGGYQIRVIHNVDAPGSPIRPRIYQLGRPTKVFDLDSFVEGDSSWITSRLGPDNDKSQDPVLPKAPQKLSHRHKKILVPNIKQALYDPLSKARLEPGSVVRIPVADDSWLIQKHRDTLSDFIDVDAAEKEYIRAWDAFIIPKRISSEAYFPRAFSSFVHEKGPWLVAKQSRLLEFGKHLSVLIARGSLRDETIRQALSFLSELNTTEMRKQHENAAEVLSSPESQAQSQSPKEGSYKSAGGCAVCGLPVLGPSLLLCSNKDCKRRLFHDDCIRSQAKMPVESSKWRCNDCCTK